MEILERGAVTLWAEPWQKPLLILFLLAWALNVALAGLGIEPIGAGRWVEAILLLSAVATSLAALARRLPLQNVLTTAVLIAAISSVLMSVGALSGIPFGPRTYADALGARLFGVLPWPVPLIWIVVIVNARGVARLIMRPWRQSNFYGWWVMGIAAVLSVVFGLALEAFAVEVRHYWSWQAVPGWMPRWYSAPLTNFLGWFVTALAILVLCTPWLINKRPVKLPMDYQPVIVWGLVQVWLALGNALHGCWTAVLVSAAPTVFAIGFSIRGARWRAESSVAQVMAEAEIRDR